MPTTVVDLRFFIDDANHGIYAHGRTSLLRDALATDLARWNRMVSCVRVVNTIFHRTTAVSLYNMSFFNPLNILTLRTLSRLFRVSATFWDTVVVPVYSSSFLTAKLDTVPAVIVPVLHDLIPLDAPASMRTWSGNSATVFSSLVEGVTVRTSCDITSVTFTPEHRVRVRCNGEVTEFDRVVFACSADAASKMLSEASALERLLLTSVGYADDDDISFLEGRVHSDAAVLPENYREEILGSFANYIEVNRGVVENTFVLSSWVPSALAAHNATPMLVTYNSSKKINKVLGTVSNLRAHPHMSLTNSAIALALRLVQGRRNTYYCGSFATPGNGHDLSLLSGFVVAHAMGAPYPFPDNAAAVADFKRLRALMGL